MKLETHSKNGSSSKLLMLFTSYLLPGIFLPLLLFKQAHDPTGNEFAFITYLFFSLIFSFTIVSEFDNLLISKSEIDVMSVLPVQDNIVVSAKLAVLFRYTFLISIPLLLPSSVFYYILLNSLSYSFLYFICGYIMFLIVVFVLLFIYSLCIRNFRSSNLSGYTLYFQIALIILLMIGYQYVSFSLSAKSGNSVTSYFTMLKEKNILPYIPQAWFAFVVSRANYVLSPNLIFKFVLPFIVTLLAYLSLRFYLMDNYSEIKEKFLHSRYFEKSQDGDAKGFFVFRMFKDFIGKVYLKNPSEKASFGLMRSMFRRDRAVKINVLPMIAIPVALAIFAIITNQLPSPFGRNFVELRPVFHITIILAALVVINTSILGLKTSNNTSAFWFYNSYPTGSKRRFNNGFRKFFNLYLVIPLCFFLFIVFLIKIPLHHALVHTLYIFVVANLFNSVYHLFNKNYPFTKENTFTNSMVRLTSMIIPFFFGTFFIILQIFVYPNIWYTLLTILLILNFTFWLNYLAFAKARD